MQPDSVGVWYSDTGLVAFGGQVSPDGPLTFTVIDMHGIYQRNTWFPEDLPTARWQKAEPPEFEKLPELPKRPLLVLIFIRGLGAMWSQILADDSIGCTARPVGREYCFGPHTFHVISHPDNDPEAVALIEAARKGE